MRDLSNHGLFRIIPDPGSQTRVTLSLESICTIPFQAGASDVKMAQLRKHTSNCGMPCLVNVFGTFRGTWDQPDKNPGALFGCMADIILNITDREIQQPGLLIARKIGQVSLVRCTFDWHDHRSGRKLTSARNISVRAEWLRQSGCALSELSETPRWRITPRPASIPRVALQIALRSPFRRFFSLCRSPILNKHSGVVANCDHTSEWVHWVHVSIGIAMGDAAKMSPCVPSTLSSRSVGR